MNRYTKASKPKRKSAAKQKVCVVMVTNGGGDKYPYVYSKEPLRQTVIERAANEDGCGDDVEGYGEAASVETWMVEVT